MDTQFPLGGIVTSLIGNRPNDKILWRITERKGEKIRLQPLQKAYTVRGNLIPGEIDPHEKSITRKIAMLYGREIIAPVVMGHIVLGLTPWNSSVNFMGRGGKRIGSGRKKGSTKPTSVKGKSVYLSPEEWAQMQCLIGSMSLSDYLRSLILDSLKKDEK
jgi:hypothetical protein